MKKTILLGTILALVFGNLKPISENGAKWVGLGVGTGAGLVAGLIAYSSLTKDQWGHKIYGEPTDLTKIISLGIGAGVGGLAGYLAYKIAMYNTPKAKFNRANDIINKTLLEELVSKKFRNSDLYIKYALGRFSSNWPLVDARRKLECIRLDLLEARSLLSAACCDIGRDYAYSYFYDGAKEQNEIIDDFLDRITDRMSILISHPFYKDQMKRYEKYKKEQRKRQEKAHERWERRREKERDRELLQNLTGNRPANIGVNFNIS